ncbi:hypothetical protein BDV39DRAFT_208739 [Aspergillus sergii]|uniref:Ankyrin repeat-containing domain protein n=1 Tax=Aspergillus sergii TaxID=1034303 RepID=A0A5N6WRU9_9EURO|nr:hypothetical protein BDV39DRAFT_208739 [Aspergillus sergii]
MPILPPEILNLIIEFLDPLDLASALYGILGIASILSIDYIHLQQNDRGETLFHLLARTGNEVSIKLLLAKEYIALDVKDERGFSLLSWAAKSGHTRVMFAGTEKPEVCYLAIFSYTGYNA